MFGTFLCNCFVDDEPDEPGSPQHYVLIHGILTSQVIYHLSEIGVNIDAIVSIKAQSYDKFSPESGPSAAEGEPAKEVRVLITHRHYQLLTFQRFISVNENDIPFDFHKNSAIFHAISMRLRTKPGLVAYKRCDKLPPS